MKRIWLKLALILIAVSISGILLSTVLSIREMDYHFSFYLDDVSQKHNQEIVYLLAEEYQKQDGWGKHAFKMLYDMAAVLDLQIELYDKDRRSLGQFQEQNQTKIFQTGTHNLIPIQSHNSIIGYVSIQHNDLFTTQSLEKHFQYAHTMAMKWTMVILALLVCLVSIPLARRIVKPIADVSQASILAAKGDLSVRVPIPKGKDEVTDLVHTFNQLVMTLQKHEELRKRLTSDIAHELRTPLNTVIAQVEGMIDGIWEANPEHLESTRHEILRLIRLVNDLDHVNQTEAGVYKNNKEKVDLSEVALQVIQAMTASFQRENIMLKSELEPAWIEGDSQRLSQVFTNLLSNSFKHTSPTGEVKVIVKKTKNHVITQIQDTGRGISEHDLPFVFERFYRGDRSRHRETGGAGLGLTIVKGIVEAHHGEIDIVSKVGYGTTVTFTFMSVPN